MQPICSGWREAKSGLLPWAGVGPLIQFRSVVLKQLLTINAFCGLACNEFCVSGHNAFNWRRMIIELLRRLQYSAQFVVRALHASFEVCAVSLQQCLTDGVVGVQMIA